MYDEMSLRGIDNLRKADEVDGDVHRRADGRAPAWGRAMRARARVCGDWVTVLLSYKRNILHAALIATAPRMPARDAGVLFVW